MSPVRRMRVPASGGNTSPGKLLGEKRQQSPVRRRNSPPGRRNIGSPKEACWNYGIMGHFKEDCLAIRCHYYKKLDHRIAECPMIPEATNWRRPRKQEVPTARASSSNKQPATKQIHQKVLKDYD